MLLEALALVALAHADPDPVQQAQEVIVERLGDTLVHDELDRAAVAGMARLVDERLGTEGNAVLTAPEHAAAVSWTEGQRSGIGVEYRVLGGRGLVITEVFDDGPGAQAGLNTNDLVIGINGMPFTGQPAHAIHQRLQQAEGAELALDVRRRKGVVERVDVPRGVYRVPAVMGIEDAMQPVLRVNYFGEGTAAAVASELAQLDPGLGVVVDLRDNEGGSIAEMVATADLFLAPGALVVSERSSKGDTVSHATLTEASFLGPVVLLVNRGTKGTAEALTGCLQYHRIARVVGTLTGGQATLSSYHPIGDGLVLRLTDIGLAAPDGRSWHGEGLRPDLVVEAPALSLPPLDRPSAASDLQREAALGLLRSPPSP